MDLHALAMINAEGARADASSHVLAGNHLYACRAAAREMLTVVLLVLEHPANHHKRQRQHAAKYDRG